MSLVTAIVTPVFRTTYINLGTSQADFVTSTSAYNAETANFVTSSSAAGTTTLNGVTTANFVTNAINNGSVATAVGSTTANAMFIIYANGSDPTFWSKVLVGSSSWGEL